MKSFVISFMLIMVVSSCSFENKVPKNIFFSRNDLTEVKELKNPEEIVIDSLLYPASFRIIKDSILVVNNQPMCDYMLEFYSLKTFKPLAQMIKRGNGPGDMLSCYLDMHSSENTTFHLMDGMARKYYKVDLDTLLYYKRLKPVYLFGYSSEINPSTFVLDNNADTYIGCNMWYSPDEKFSNGISMPLSVFNKNVDNKKPMTDYEYFTPPVTGLLLFKNPQNGLVWAADTHCDRIYIYNDSLQLLSTIDGPDHIEVSYETVQSNSPVPFVTFTNKRDIHGYADYFITDKFIYLVYEGNEHFEPMELSPVEMFKFDFDGNILCNYKFDRYVYSISVDNNDSYLYCASRKNMQEPPTILRYKL